MSPRQTLMVVGTGQLARATVLDVLPDLGDTRLVIAGRDGEVARRFANLCRQVSAERGRTLEAVGRRLDLDQVDDAAATISEVTPDVIYAAVTRMSWWAPQLLPADAAALLSSANTGPWLACHLSLVRRLMMAVREASSDAFVVNASFPDVTHPVLATQGLAPHVGIGNIAIAAAGSRVMLADRYKAEPSQVEMRAVFHHYVNFMATRTGGAGAAPFRLHASIPGEVDGYLDEQDAFGLLATEYKRLSGASHQQTTAATAGTVLRGALGAPVVTHAPGPLGLPGGYPVEVSPGSVELRLPPGLSLADAVKVNIEGGRFDGIERIYDDGSVAFTDACAQPLREHLGAPCDRLYPNDADDAAHELVERLSAFAESRGVDLPERMKR